MWILVCTTGHKIRCHQQMKKLRHIDCIMLKNDCFLHETTGVHMGTALYT